MSTRNWWTMQCYDVDVDQHYDIGNFDDVNKKDDIRCRHNFDSV